MKKKAPKKTEAEQKLFTPEETEVILGQIKEEVRKGSTAERFKAARDLVAKNLAEDLVKLGNDEILEVDGIEITEVPPEPQEPTPPQLTKEELFRLQLSQAQARAAEAEVALEILKRELLQKRIDPENKLGQMAAFIRGRTQEVVDAKAAYTKVVSEIETRLSISLKEWAYDDQSGILSKVDQ